MRKFLLTAALAQCAALALLLAACKAPDGADAGRGGAATTANAPAANTPNPAQTAQAPADIVRRVTAAELKGMLDRGEAVVVDVRTKPDFDRERIKGARSIPLGEAAARASELPKDKLIVFYCA
jgi:3-mercaptopyruvate sulfurtransferase SseA